MIIFFVYDDKEDCGRFDFCFRLWYVEIVIYEVKDVVFVIDISVFMIGEKFYVVKEVVKIVLDIMNFKD